MILSRRITIRIMSWPKVSIFHEITKSGTQDKKEWLFEPKKLILSS